MLLLVPIWFPIGVMLAAYFKKDKDWFVGGLKVTPPGLLVSALQLVINPDDEGLLTEYSFAKVINLFHIFNNFI